MMRYSLIIALLVTGLSSPVLAQSASGAASLTVSRGLSVATVRPMRLQLSPGDAALSVTGVTLADAPAMIQISGDPGRVYRIRLAPVGEGATAAVIDDLRIWSANAGDISVARVSHMDLQGRDLLRVSGRLRVSENPAADAVATLPLSIDYE